MRVARGRLHPRVLSALWRLGQYTVAPDGALHRLSVSYADELRPSSGRGVIPPVRGFALTGAARACATPEGAYANCLALSAGYDAWLREAGVPAGMSRCAGAGRVPLGRGPLALCDPEGHAHWVVFSGDCCVDWTWRQFEPVPGGRPLRCLSTRWAERWREVTVWACESLPRVRRRPSATRRRAPIGLHAEHRAIAHATGGAGPFPDPRHDHTPPLAPM